MQQILTFEPQYKSVIWGGKRIAEFKGEAPAGDHVGESWELSPVPGHESIVADGTLKGKKFTDAVSEYPADILGAKIARRFDGKFPLLVKFIDSNDDLSVQVHPDDALAMKRHGSLGKTEMWYSVAPAPGAYLYAGFSRRVGAEEFKRLVADNEIIPALARFDTHPGDVFYLPAGRVHSIGRGNFVLEIQEASDITYRIYDYDRRDAQGNPRQLHIAESVDAINFDDVVPGDVLNVAPVADKTLLLADSAYFTTEVTGVDGEMTLDLATRDSFTIVVAVKGDLDIEGPDNSVRLTQGHTALIPASVCTVVLRGHADIVTTYIK